MLGWRGAYLEADAAAFAALERRFAANPRVRTVHAAVEPDTVEALFTVAGVPEEPDVVSIDVDGNDYWIWRALTPPPAGGGDRVQRRARRRRPGA